MSNLEPSYLRYIYDGLEKGDLHPDNAASLPEGLIGLYEEAFDENKPAAERQKLLNTFVVWALLKKEVSAQFVAEILGVPPQEIIDFIANYSSWFTSPESGKYQLYHERLKVYLLQKVSEVSVNFILSNLIICLTKKNQSVEISNYAKEWKGFYFLLNGDITSGFDFLQEKLQENMNDQNQNWWENTFELYCTCIFTSDDYQISESEINLYSKLRDQLQCLNAAKLVTKNFENISWEEFSHFSYQTRFHYLLAEVLNSRFNELPNHLVSRIILEESHYLSYILAYAWKYNCWKNENLLYPDLIEKIKSSSSPYLRIVLRQIDGGRIMLEKSPVLKETDYSDCWEYLSEDFLEHVKIGKDKVLEKYYNDVMLYSNLVEKDLIFILDEFNSLHIQTEKLRNVKIQIQRSSYFFQIIEILWHHPAWEIGEFGNDLVRNKLKNTKSQASKDELINWIYSLAKEKYYYSIAILIFDIIEVSDISEEYVNEIIESILGWQEAQIRGQFIASANNFFNNNRDEKWFELFKVKLFELCKLASDIWETQEILDLFTTLNDRLSTDEINSYTKLHKLLNKIPNASQLDYKMFWQTAEQMRLRGEI